MMRDNVTRNQEAFKKRYINNLPYENFLRIILVIMFQQPTFVNFSTVGALDFVFD